MQMLFLLTIFFLTSSFLSWFLLLLLIICLFPVDCWERIGTQQMLPLNKKKHTSIIICKQRQQKKRTNAPNQCCYYPIDGFQSPSKYYWCPNIKSVHAEIMFDSNTYYNVFKDSSSALLSLNAKRGLKLHFYIQKMKMKTNHLYWLVRNVECRFDSFFFCHAFA